MHIVFLTNEYPKGTISHGGIGSFVQNLARNLVLNKIDASVIGLTNEKDEVLEFDKGVEIHRIPQSKMKFGKFIFNSLKIKAKLKEINLKKKIDIVEGSELSFAFLPKKTSYKKVIRMHGGHHFFAVTLNKEPAFWRSYQEKKSFNKANALIAVSNYVGKTTKELLKFELPYTVIYNFIDLDIFKVSDKQVIEGNSIVFVGTVCEKKGVKQLVEAFSLIKEKIPSVKLHVVGRDWSSKIIKSYIEYLKSSIPTDHLKAIIFHGALPYNEIPSILEKAAVCVYPSHMESFGLTLVEAMAMGKSIVYSSIPPFNEIITNKQSGLSCNPMSAIDISNKIASLLNNEVNSKELSKNARIEVCAKFDKDKLVFENINFYKRLLL